MHDDFFDQSDYHWGSGIIHKDSSLRSTDWMKDRSFNSLDPLRSPRRRLKRITKVIRFTCNLTVSELHDGYCIDWLPIISNNYFRNPEISFSPYSQNLKTKFCRVMCSEFVYVVFTRDSFTRLWKFNLWRHHDKCHVICLYHEPQWPPSKDLEPHVYLGYPISYTVLRA
jgi:hypothetical protein